MVKLTLSNWYNKYYDNYYVFDNIKCLENGITVVSNGI